MSRKALQKDYQETLENDLSCAICQDIYINPFMLNCSHSFCKFCVYRWLSKQTGCPQCRMTVTFQGENLALRNIINKMVQKSSDEFQKHRTNTVNQRLKEEEAQEKDGTMNLINKAANNRPRTSRYRYHRNSSEPFRWRPSSRALRTIFPRDSPSAEIIEISSGPDSDSDTSFTFGTLAQFFSMHGRDDELEMEMDDSEDGSDFDGEESDADDDDLEDDDDEDDDDDDDDDEDEDEDEEAEDADSDDDEEDDEENENEGEVVESNDEASDIVMSEDSSSDVDENIDADVDSNTDGDDNVNVDDNNADQDEGDNNSTSESEWSDESSDSDSSDNWSSSLEDDSSRLSLNNIVFGGYSDDAENGNETEDDTNHSWDDDVRGQLRDISPNRSGEIIPRDRYSDESTIEYATSTDVSLSSDESL